MLKRTRDGLGATSPHHLPEVHPWLCQSPQHHEHTLNPVNASAGSQLGASWVQVPGAGSETAGDRELYLPKAKTAALRGRANPPAAARVKTQDHTALRTATRRGSARAPVKYLPQ